MTASQISWILVGTWSGLSLVSFAFAQKPRRTTIVPAISVAQIVSMLNVMPMNSRVTW